MRGFIRSPLVFMLLVNVLLLIVGCLMTTDEAILCLALVIWQPWIAMVLVDGKLPW